MRTFCFSYWGWCLASGRVAAKITGRHLAARLYSVSLGNTHILLPLLGVALRCDLTPNRVNRTLLDHQGKQANRFAKFVFCSAHGKIAEELPQMMPGGVSPTREDLANISGRMHSHFDMFWCFCMPDSWMSEFLEFRIQCSNGFILTQDEAICPLLILLFTLRRVQQGLPPPQYSANLELGPKNHRLNGLMGSQQSYSTSRLGNFARIITVFSDCRLMGMSCFLVQKWICITKVSCFSVHFCSRLSPISCSR